MGGSNSSAYSSATAQGGQGPSAAGGGVDTVLTFGPGDQVYLNNIQPFQLTANDFIFT